MRASVRVPALRTKISNMLMEHRAGVADLVMMCEVKNNSAFFLRSNIIKLQKELALIEHQILTLYSQENGSWENGL